MLQKFWDTLDKKASLNFKLRVTTGEGLTKSALMASAQ